MTVGVDVNTLYQATRDADKVEWDKAEEKVDKEFPNLRGFDRQMKLLENLSGGNQSRALSEAIRMETLQFREGGESDIANHDAHLTQLGEAFDRLPPEKRGEVLFTAMLNPDGFSQAKFEEGYVKLAREAGITKAKVQSYLDVVATNKTEERDRLMKGRDENGLYIFALLPSMSNDVRQRILSQLDEGATPPSRPTRASSR